MKPIFAITTNPQASPWKHRAVTRSLLTFLTLATALHAHAQWGLETYNLRGPVKKMTLKIHSLNADGSLAPPESHAHEEVYEFNTRGRLLAYTKNAIYHYGKIETLKASYTEDTILVREEIRLEGALMEITELEYDARGNLVNDCKTRIEGDDTTLIQILTRYDSHDRAVESRIYENDTLRRKNVFTFDARGNNILYAAYDARGLEIWDLSRFDQENHEIMSIGFDSPFAFLPAFRHMYNEKGQEVKTLFFNAQGQLDYESTHRYHPNGRLAQDSIYSYPISVTKAADPTDNAITANDGQRKPAWSVHDYDSLGNTLQIKGNNGGSTQVEQWSYTYDSYGSWLTQTWGPPGYRQTRTIRTLEYY